MMKAKVLFLIFAVLVSSIFVCSQKTFALQSMGNLMETDPSMPDAAKEIVGESSTSMKQSVVLVFFGRFAAPQVARGKANIITLKSNFKETYMKNVPADKQDEYGELIKSILSSVDISVNSDGKQGVVKVKLANNSNAALIFTYNTDTEEAVGQKFAILDKEPTLISVTTAEAIALVEGSQVLDSLNVSPLTVMSALLKTSMQTPQEVAQASTVLTQTVFELVGTQGLTVAQTKTKFHEAIAKHVALPADKAEQMVNVLTLFVQGAKPAETGADTSELKTLIVSQNKAAQMQNATAEKQEVAIAAQLDPAQVGLIRQLVESQAPDMKNTLIIREGTAPVVDSIKGTLESAGLVLDKVVVRISAGAYSPENKVGVDVSVVGGKSFVSITSVSKEAEKVVAKSDLVLGQKTDGVTDVLKLGESNRVIYGGIAEMLTSTKAEAIKDSASIEVKNNVRDNLDKDKIIVFDGRFFASVDSISEEGVVFRLAAIDDDATLSAITENKDKIHIVTYIPEDMIPAGMSKENITIDAQDLVRSLADKGLPVEYIETIIDSNLVKQVSGLAEVNINTMQQVFDAKYGKDNTQVHYVVQQNSADAIKLLADGAVEGRTFTMFDGNLNGKKARSWGTTVAQAMVKIIIGKQELGSSDRTATRAILAAINVDMTELELDQFAKTELQPVGETKIVNLDKEHLLVVAFGTQV